MTAPITVQESSAPTTDNSAIRPFQKVNFPEAELTELRRRINNTKWPEREQSPMRPKACSSRRLKRSLAIGPQSMRRKIEVVWTPPSSGPYSHEIWAPELHFLNGKWYIYFAADAGTNQSHRVWVLENPSPDPLQGEWIMKGKLADPDDRWAIDPTVFENRGHLYVQNGGKARPTACNRSTSPSCRIPGPSRAAAHASPLRNIPGRKWATAILSATPCSEAKFPYQSDLGRSGRGGPKPGRVPLTTLYSGHRGDLFGQRNCGAKVLQVLFILISQLASIRIAPSRLSGGNAGGRDARDGAGCAGNGCATLGCASGDCVIGD